MLDVAGIERRLRRRRMAWADLAKTCGVSSATVNNWRAGRVLPTVDAALDIADALGFSDTRAIAVRPGRQR